MFGKKVAFGRKRIGRVYAPSRAKIVIFTHPIFESDFDCLTGKNRLHANSLPSPIASDKNKNLLRKKNIFTFFFSILKTKLAKDQSSGPKKKNSKKKNVFFFNFKFLKIGIKPRFYTLSIGQRHTAQNEPVLVRSLKLNQEGRGQYLHG